jgi:hypothetical protein
LQIIKLDELHLQAYANISKACTSIGHYPGMPQQPTAPSITERESPGPDLLQPSDAQMLSSRSEAEIHLKRA